MLTLFKQAFILIATCILLDDCRLYIYLLLCVNQTLTHLLSAIIANLLSLQLRVDGIHTTFHA